MARSAMASNASKEGGISGREMGELSRFVIRGG